MTFGDNVTVVGKLEVSIPVSADVEFSEIVSVGTIDPVEVKAADPVGEGVGKSVSVLFAEIVTSVLVVALPANDVVTDEPVVMIEPEPVGVAEEAPVAVLDVTPVPGPVTPPLIVESDADAEAVPVADPETLLVKLERSEVTPLRSELSRPEPDAVELGDAVEEIPVPGPVTPPEIVEDTSVVVSAAVADAVVAPVLGPVTPPEMVDAPVADTSVDVPRSVLVRLERSEETPPRRELKRPPLDDDAVVEAAVAVMLVPVPAPVIPETVVSVSELVAVSLIGVAVELVTPVPEPVAEASIVEVVSVEASAVSVVDEIVELVTPVPAPVAEASIVDVSSDVVVAVSVVDVGEAVVVAPVADASIVELESVVVASSVFATLETSETRLVTSETSALPKELSPSPPVDAVVVAAAESMVDVVSVAVIVAESVVEELVSVAESSVVDDTIMPLEVCEASEVVSEAVEETMPVGAITIEVNADEVGETVLVVVSSTVEEAVEASEDELEVEPTVGEMSVVSVGPEVVVSESEASKDESKFESEDEVKPCCEAVEPCEDESSLLVRLWRTSVNDRPWL